MAEAVEDLHLLSRAKQVPALHDTWTAAAAADAAAAAAAAAGEELGDEQPLDWEPALAEDDVMRQRAAAAAMDSGVDFHSSMGGGVEDGRVNGAPSGDATVGLPSCCWTQPTSSHPGDGQSDAAAEQTEPASDIRDAHMPPAAEDDGEAAAAADMTMLKSPTGVVPHPCSPGWITALQGLEESKGESRLCHFRPWSCKRRPAFDRENGK